MALTKAERELRSLLADYDPAVVKLYFALRAVVKRAASDANEIVYDAGYTVSDVFSFTERWQDSFCMVTAHKKHVNLILTWGAKLPDPERRLRGNGKQMRHLQVRKPEDLESDDICHFLDAAIAKARTDRAKDPGSV